MKYEIPKLEYGYDALEPFIDAQTMLIHHTKHHQAYTDKLNGVLEKYPAIADVALEETMRNLTASGMTEADQKVFRNHGGGYLNHNLYWTSMGPAKHVNQALVDEVTSTFGNIDELKKKLGELALGQFGSGWAWLVRTADGKLETYATPNQDSPYLQNQTPIIGIDVWEHAYYLKYQNKRADYIQQWWNVLTVL
jgi:Fe-Mn family superoxide dismutase